MVKKRLLAGIEHGLAFSNDYAPFNAVCVVRIEGRLEPEKLRAAFDTLQRRHPLLRVGLVSEKGSYYFSWGDVGPIPLDVLPRKTPDDWIAATEVELDERMDVAAGPLLRCKYLHDPGSPDGESEIILTFNHTILDAASAQPLLRELLQACAGAQAPALPEISREGEVSAVALFPRRLTGLGFTLAAGAYMARQMSDEAAYQWRARGCRKPPISESARNRILPLRLSKQLTDALIHATRHRRITMNSILGAALMLATKRHLYPAKDTPFRAITFADLRPYLRETVPEEMLACHMGMCRLTFQVSDRSDFWNLARELNTGIYRSNKRGERFLANALTPGMMKMIVRMKKMRMGTTALSYAGPISIDRAYGSIRVRGLHAFTANMPIGPEFSALARYFLGEVWLDLLYIDTDMDSQMAGRIAEEMRGILTQAALPPESLPRTAGPQPHS